MNLPKHAPVDADEAAGRRVAHVARLAVTLGVTLVVLILGVLRSSPPNASAPAPVAAATEYVAADAAPVIRALEPMEHEIEQREYVTHGG